ncbi:MAG: cyclase family protein [Oscillospiraceae bacterium]|jgi:kynurenine formamidase|nr:cyclase family protein [Oscillospiraceae bacterium]
MRIIDLSHRLDNATPAYPGDPPPLLGETRILGKDGYALYCLHSGMHAGTHIDMPSHMLPDSRMACDFDPALFAGEGLLLDVRGEGPVCMKPEYRSLPLKGRAVLLWTGFDSRFYDAGYFFDYPVVEEELARFLLDGGIKMLGIDAPAPDKPPFPVHKLLLGNGVFILENVTNLQELQGIGRFTVMALPLKIAAEASLVRAVALVM